MNYQSLKEEILTGACKVIDKRIIWFPSLEAATAATSAETTKSEE